MRHECDRALTGRDPAIMRRNCIKHRMAQTTLLSILQGGDRRSLGRANELVALILGQPKRFPELLECLWCDDPVVRMRAVDAAEKISAQRAHLLRPFKAELLGLAGETGQQELRWHLALMIPRLPLTRVERKRAITLLKQFLSDRSSIVKTCALQGLAELAQGNAEMRSEVAGVVEEASTTGTPAMKARARKLLPKLRG
jgi:HEAT repeat protein